MKELDIFRKVSRDSIGYAREWKERTGGKVVAYLCSYAPEELIHAAGALPVRIFGTVDSISKADAYLQTYCCSLARGGLEEALSGRLDFMEGAVFPHTCDTIQRLSDIWRLNAGFALHFDVIMPVKLDTESAQDYMRDILKKFRRDIEEGLETTIADAEIKKSISLYNKIRRSLHALYTLHSQHPTIITGSDLYAVMKSSMVMDRADFDRALDTLLIALKEVKPDTEKEARLKRIVMAGGICNHPDIYSILEKFGAAVVWDDLCTGVRYFEETVPETGDPVSAIADRYFKRAVCPAKHRGNTERGDNLLRIVKDHRAAGVVFLILKFCDPHSFDYPYMKEFLDNENIPSLLLEIEEQLPPMGQLSTRFEAFIEML